MSCSKVPIFSVFVIFISVAYSFETIKRTPNFYIDWENDRFIKDGRSWQYVAGGFHYFRSVPEYWARTISTAKSAGLNAIQSYVAWDMHEPRKGTYNFRGRMDIIRFIKEVQRQDMALILRVGPYICAEKSFGGLPAWLLTIPDMEVRTTNPLFLAAVKEWLGVFLQKIRPFLYNNGGPIIMLQIENEYGVFGCDPEYLSRMYDLFYSELGDEVVYFTVDGPGDYKCGSYNDTKVLTTIDYLEDNDKGQFTEEYFRELRRFQPRGPLVNSEYYTGFLDKWGTPHKSRAAVSLGDGIRKLLSLGANLALFVWHGGSNFGLDGADYTATATYDYDAPLSESGDIKRDKYWAIRDALDEFFPKSLLPEPQPIPKLYGKTVHLQQRKSLVDLLTHENFIVYNQFPLKMEEMGELEGIIGYKHELTAPLVNAQLAIQGLHDRAYVLVDGRFVKVVKREEEGSFAVSGRTGITILVENMGYMAWLSQGLGDYSNEYKGMKNVTINGKVLEKWKHYKMETGRVDGNNLIVENMDNTRDKLVKVDNTRDKLVKVDNTRDRQNSTRERYWYNRKPLLHKGPTVFSGELELAPSELLDTFVDTTCWSKGFLVVNGRVVGRYWPDAGPQYTLYVPGVFWREGINKITMVELQSQCDHLAVSLTDKHVINGPVHNDQV